jgi:hypothetical protein
MNGKSSNSRGSSLLDHSSDKDKDHSDKRRVGAVVIADLRGVAVAVRNRMRGVIGETSLSGLVVE